MLEVSLGSLYYGFYFLLLLTFSLPLAVSDSGSFKGNASSPFSWLGKQCYSEREWKASVHGPLVHLRVLPAAFEFHYVPKLFCADAGKAPVLSPVSYPTTAYIISGYLSSLVTDMEVTSQSFLGHHHHPE